MAFIVETGMGLELANSYCTVEFADGFNSTQIDGVDWADVDPADKQIRLITATLAIDNSFDFDGRRLTRIQALEFPRWGLYDRNGYIVEAAPLPRFIKCATAELARVLGQRSDAGGSATVPSAGSAAGGVEKIQVGPIALTLATTSASTAAAATSGSTAVAFIPRSVSSWLLDYATPRFGYGSARLVR